LYLAAMLDIYSRKVVGWVMDKHMQQELVASALRMAITQRRPGDGVLRHTDRGSQYVDRDYQQLLGAHKMVVSMSKKGIATTTPLQRVFGRR
jgi:transposase InsO family protein